MRVGRSGIEICSAVPGSINNSILWDRKCPKKFCLKDYEVLKYFFPISAKEDNVGDSEKDVQSDWVSVWLLLVAKSFERLLSESVCQSERLSRCGKPVKPSGSVCQSQRPRKKSSHPTLLRKYCQVIKQIQPLYYANTAKLFNKYNHSIDANTFCNIWGKYVIFRANNDTRRSNQNSKPLLCDKYPLGNLFLKLFLFFPLSHFVKLTFFLLFSRGGRFSWGVELRNATSDANRASTTFLQQPNGSESWDFRQLKKKFEFSIEIKLGFHCTLYNN